MSALLPEPTLIPSRRYPAGVAPLVDELALQKLILEWQADPQTELLNQILLCCEPIVTGLVFSKHTPVIDPDEVLSYLRTKIWKKLPHFNPNRGRSFTYVTIVAKQALSEIRTSRQRTKARYPQADNSELDFLKPSWEWITPAEALADILWRIYTVQTIFTDPYELESQRWLVRSLLESEFKLRRHEAADATVIVYGLSPRRARRIHDYTVLEIRRTLLPVIEVPTIKPAGLKGTREAAMRKFADQLSSEDFSKLIYLMRNLAPAIIDNLDHVLNGHPEARPLFDGN